MGILWNFYGIFYGNFIGQMIQVNVGEMLKHGAKVDTKNKRGFTTLHLAAKKGHLKVVAVLLASGTKIDLHLGLNPEGCNGCEMPKGDLCYPNGSALHLGFKIWIC